MHRNLLDLFFVALIFEGAVRRLFLPEYAVEIQVVRDALPTLALLAFCLNRRANEQVLWPPSYAGVFLVIYVGAGLTQFGNPELWSPLVGILGIRTHFSYLPLLVLAPYYIRSERELVSRLRCLCLFAVPVVGLGIYQTQLPSSHFLNRGLDATFGLQNLVRASGTFSYITGYGIFAQFAVVAAVVLLTLVPMRSRDGVIAVVGAWSGLAGCLSSGSRAPVFGALIQVIIFCIILVRAYPGGRVPKSIARILGVSIPVAGLVLSQFQDVSDAFFERASASAGDVDDRLISGTVEWITVAFNHPLGNGIGMAHQQAGALVGLPMGFLSGFEDELSRIAYELGLVGVLSLVAFRLCLMVEIFRRANRLDPVRAAVAALSLSTLVVFITGAVYTPVANALFMLMAGLGTTVVTPARVRTRPATASRSPVFRTRKA